MGNVALIFYVLYRKRTVYFIGVHRCTVGENDIFFSTIFLNDGHFLVEKKKRKNKNEEMLHLEFEYFS